MKLKITFVCLLFVAILFSCKKDEPLAGVNTPGGNPASTLLLSKVLTDNQPSFEYIYNSAKLISEEKSKFYFTLNKYNDQNQLISSDYYTNFNILSSDLQVYQSAMDQKEWVTPDNPNKGGTIKYEYASTGQLNRATYSPVSGSVQYSEFSYDGAGRINKQMLYWEDKETGYIDYTYDGKGNLVKEILYNISSTGDPELSTTTEYEFDSKLNPYKAVSKLQTPGINTNLNNITKETYTIKMPADEGPDTVEVTATSYTYNDKGYPVSKNGNIAYIYG